MFADIFHDFLYLLPDPSKQAGAIIRKTFRTGIVDKVKTETDPVTETDLVLPGRACCGSFAYHEPCIPCIHRAFRCRTGHQRAGRAGSKWLLLHHEPQLQLGQQTLAYLQGAFNCPHGVLRRTFRRVACLQACEAAVKAILTKAFPTHAFLGEEESCGEYRISDEPTWVCDPGARAYVRR